MLSAEFILKIINDVNADGDLATSRVCSEVACYWVYPSWTFLFHTICINDKTDLQSWINLLDTNSKLNLHGSVMSMPQTLMDINLSQLQWLQPTYRIPLDSDPRFLFHISFLFHLLISHIHLSHLESVTVPSRCYIGFHGILDSSRYRIFQTYYFLATSIIF